MADQRGSSSHRLISVRRHGVQRTLVMLRDADRRTYARLAAAAAPAVEGALDERVVANRVATARIDPLAFALRSWRVERRAFAVALRELASRSEALLFADVRACYRSIRPARVRAALDRLGAPGVDEIEAFLRRLERDGLCGLPVGPDASALFANAVLAPVDAALRDRDLRHLRWVDDVVIGIAGPDRAPEALALVVRSLEALGLRLNERKTRVVVDPGVLVRHVSGVRGARPGVG